MSRARRFTPDPARAPKDLSPLGLRLLWLLAQDCGGLASLPQLAALAGISQKAARRLMRGLFDFGAVNVVPLPRFLLDERTASPHELLYGSSPNVFVLARKGVRALREAGCEVEDTALRDRNDVSPLFVRHELLVRDFLVWLRRCEGLNETHSLEQWHMGPAAQMEYQVGAERQVVRPDAWFVLRVGEKRLVAALEADRGTEKLSGPHSRWLQKAASYTRLVESGRLPEITGFANLRVLVVCPGATRRDRLADFLAKRAPEACARRVWIAERSILESGGLSGAVWRRSLHEGLCELIPPAIAPRVKP